MIGSLKTFLSEHPIAAAIIGLIGVIIATMCGLLGVTLAGVFDIWTGEAAAVKLAIAATQTAEAKLTPTINTLEPVPDTTVQPDTSPSSDASVNETDDTTWFGEYFDNAEFSGPPVYQRNDDFIEFNFPDLEEIVAEKVAKDDLFSIRWTRCFEFDEGVYTFSAMADDSLEAWIDGNTPLINASALMGANLRERDIYISGGKHCLKVDFRENTGGAVAIFKFHLNDAPSAQASSSVWHGKYFNNSEFKGSPVYERNYAYIDFEWGRLGRPGPEIGTENFSIRWTQCLNFNEDTYIFRARADDNIKVYLDGDVILDVSASEGIKEETLSVSGGEHCLEVQFVEYGGFASVYFDFRTE